MCGKAGIVNWNNFIKEAYIIKMNSITYYNKTKVSIKGVL